MSKSKKVASVCVAHAVASGTKTIKKRVKIEKVASLCVVYLEFLQKPFKNDSKSKGCFDFHGLVGLITKTIHKRVKIEKVASICVV